MTLFLALFSSQFKILCTDPEPTVLRDVKIQQPITIVSQMYIPLVSRKLTILLEF